MMTDTAVLSSIVILMYHSFCHATHPALASGVATDVLIDSRIPDECSSPGWVEAPYDISVLLGGYVYFNCRSSMTHSNTTWLYEGRRELTAVTSKVMIFNRNSSLRFGPVGYDDDGLSIGCEVLTEFGKLPSSLGRITVKSEWLDVCSYSYNVIQRHPIWFP